MRDGRRVDHVIHHDVPLRVRMRARPRLDVVNDYRLTISWAFNNWGKGDSEELEEALRESYKLDAWLAEGLLRTVMGSDKLGPDEKELVVKALVEVFARSIPQDRLLKMLSGAGAAGAGGNRGGWADLR